MDTEQRSSNGNSDNNEQAALWNGDAGRAWVEVQELLDTMFRPIEDMLVEAVAKASAQQVLDVGCGTGSTTLAVARRLGANGRCVGIDISEPMIAMAKARTAREGLSTAFICADAQRHVFTPQSFDLIMSRFGVMFFDDAVSAFRQLRQAARTQAQLHCYAWRSAEENPFMTTAERAALPFFPQMPARQPDAPGQFAFANAHRVRGILEHAGWTAIDILPVDVACAFAEQNLMLYLTRMGSLGRALVHAEEQTRQRVLHTVRAAFDPYVHGQEVRFVAACWRVSARCSTCN